MHIPPLSCRQTISKHAALKSRHITSARRRCRSKRAKSRCPVGAGDVPGDTPLRRPFTGDVAVESGGAGLRFKRIPGTRCEERVKYFITLSCANLEPTCSNLDFICVPARLTFYARLRQHSNPWKSIFVFPGYILIPNNCEKYARDKINL